MKRNNSLKRIGEELIKADSVLIFPHILMDGDALGSAVALCIALRQKGKICYVVIEDKIADYLFFMAKDYCIGFKDVAQAADISLCIDCGNDDRFPKRKELFWKGKKTICIDHHETSKKIADLNYIDGKAAATGELIYDLLVEMEAEINVEMAECIFAAIATDTGNFMYANTRRKSHEITMDLMDKGLNSNKIYVAIYENESVEKMLLHSRVMADMEIFADGQCALGVVTQKMLKETNTLMEDTEGLVGKLRSLKGVEIAILIKEKESKVIKVSMRAKNKGNVAEISAKYNGGGHVKAAGCTIYDSASAAKEIIIKEATKALEE